jgi:type I restriction enzyme S subunit
MRAMKDSGVDWLGALPKDWNASRIGSLFSERKQQVSSNTYAPLSVTKSGVVPQLDSAAKSDSTETRKMVRSGDFVINSRSDRKGSSGLSPYDGSCSSIYIVLLPTGLEGEFAHRVLRSEAFQEEFFRWGTGIVDDLWSTRYSNMKMIRLPVPPLEEQRSIVSYLKHETSQIDLLVSKKEQLIETLLERRNALITHVVTKGLRPMQQLGPGADWSGAVSLNWKVEKASRLFRARKGSQAAKLSVEYCASHAGDFPVYSGQTENQGIMAQVDSFEFDFGERSVLLTTTVGSSKVMSVRRISGKFSLSQNCMILENTRESELHNGYAYWMITAAFNYKKLQLESHMQSSFRMADFYSYKLLVPTLEEQIQIASHLDNEALQIDSLVEKTMRSIDLLRERRKALITQVVTGKIDVRGFAGGNP